MAKLNSMKYKTFTWVNNPSTCTFSCDRAFVQHKYPEIKGVDLEDMGVNAIVISGEGQFFGTGAYTKWLELNAVYNEQGVGEFYHPIYTNISTALMTKLSSNIEPREDYISYSFEITSHNPPNDSYSIVEEIINTGSTSGAVIKVGDIVIVNGRGRYTSYGGLPESYLMTEKTMTVTYTNYKPGAGFPVHVGQVGWMALSAVRLANSGTVNTSSGTDILYTVKPGDTLSGICARYNVNWQGVATYNNLKNPNLINPGQIIRIKG